MIVSQYVVRDRSQQASPTAVAKPAKAGAACTEQKNPAGKFGLTTQPEA